MLAAEGGTPFTPQILQSKVKALVVIETKFQTLWQLENTIVERSMIVSMSADGETGWSYLITLHRKLVAHSARCRCSDLVVINAWTRSCSLILGK